MAITRWGVHAWGARPWGFDRPAYVPQPTGPPTVTVAARARLRDVVAQPRPRAVAARPPTGGTTP